MSMKKEGMMVNVVSVSAETKYFGLVRAEIDHSRQRVTLKVRKPGPGGKSKRYGKKGRDKCIKWALKSLQDYQRQGYYFSGF